MYKDDGSEYTYKEALKLKEKTKPAIAAKHNTRQLSMNFAFDTVQDADGFSKAVLRPEEPKARFTVVQSFTNPRNGDDLRPDYSEKCIIL